MIYKLIIRFGGRLIMEKTDLLSIKEIRVGEVMNLNSFFPEQFPTANFGKCVDRTYEVIENVEICNVHLETVYK